MSEKTSLDDTVDYWSDIFGEVTLTVIPLKYLLAVTVNFKNGTVWNINVKKRLTPERWDAFQEHIQELATSYLLDIESIDYKLNTDRIRKDVSRCSARFLKSKKL